MQPAAQEVEERLAPIAYHVQNVGDDGGDEHKLFFVQRRLLPCEEGDLPGVQKIVLPGIHGCSRPGNHIVVPAGCLPLG